MKLNAPVLIGLLTVLVAVARAPAARAETTRSKPAQSLGIDPDAGMGVNVGAVAGAPPSLQHAWGTLMLAWCEDGGPNVASSVHLGEWGLAEGVWLTRRVVRRPTNCPSTISLARSGDRLVMATGSEGLSRADLLVLERARDGVFAETAALAFDDAHGASLDADENVIALGVFVYRTPVVKMPPGSSTAPPECALHVRLLEPSTLRIVSSRVIRGEHLLRPHQVARAASNALRLHAGRLFVAVPDDDPRIVSLRIPSLSTERERTFVVPSFLRTPFSSSIALSTIGGDLLIGIGETFVLSTKLEIVARHRMAIRQPIAFDQASRRVLASDGEAVTLDGYRVRVFSDRSGGTDTCVLFAHGRGVVIRAEVGASATIRVVP